MSTGQRPPATLPSHAVYRVSITVRLRTDLADSLRGESIRRRLHGVQPRTIQAILEEAVECWLMAQKGI